MARTYRCPEDHHKPSVTCYVHGCGCEGCRAANAAAQRRRRRRKAAGFETSAIDAAPSTARVRALRELGWTVRDIALASGVGDSTISDLMRGVRKRVTPETAAMLAHRLRRPRKPPRGLVDATGTRRRLQALTAHGWSVADLAPMIGRDRRNLRDLYTQDVCERQSRDAVAALYARLWDKPAPAKSKSRSRARAARYGWVGALAWDNIDDPTETPKISAPKPPDQRGSAVWRIDEADMLRESGESVDHAMRALNTNRVAFARLARNHKRLDLVRWVERVDDRELAA